jgi:hypothetical protein
METSQKCVSEKFLVYIEVNGVVLVSVSATGYSSKWSV